MLKVLQLIPTLDRSGAEKQMVLLAEGLPRDRFHVEVAALTRLGPAGGRARARRGSPSRRSASGSSSTPLALARLVRFMQGAAVRRRADLDLRGQHLRPARGAAGRGAGGGHGRDGRRPLEEEAASWRSTAAWRAGPTAWWATRRRWSTSTDGSGIPDDRLAMIPSGIGDEEPPAVDPGRGPRRVRLARRRPPGPLRRPAGARRRGSTTCSTALDLLQHVRPDLRTLIVGDGPLRDAARRDGARLRARRHGPVPRPPRRRPAAPGRRRPARPAQPLRGPAQRRARGDAVPQAGRRHRRAGDDRGRRRRPDRPARPPARPPGPGPGDPRP